ncbi:DUF998 domain-containing protein [Nonomuraea spiralis]|uniref:DUF998 domain-containing protein n=1 Tax=Nonomuraea TaxID=83681 RepID=UPI000F7668CD|nr:DUF998 domain-containing protein [Nonomuraea sp. WAC 01424]RSM94234.1 hypothetical protein DMB42_51455 [Nonomuraea sp. WAC 01424]
MTWRAVLGPVAGAVTAVAALGYAQAALPAQPLISDYALVPGGMLPVLVGTLALAAACLSLAYGLAAREPARTAATRVLLLAGAAGLMLSAIFPTDPGMSDVSTLTGEIHRWSAAVVFTALPVAGWTLTRGRAAAPRWSAVKALSVTSGLTLAAYLAAHPAALTSSLIDGETYYGLLERGVVLAEIVLVVAMALASVPRRAAARVQGTRATGAPAQPESPQRLAA